MPVRCAPGGSGPADGPGRAGAAAFTLVELLVVLGVLALLAAILVPSLSQVTSIAHAALCRNNLKGIGQAVHGNAGTDPYSLPSPSGWIGMTTRFGSKELLFCREDKEEMRVTLEPLADLYILQVHAIGSGTWLASSIKAAMEGGSVPDPQVKCDIVPLHPSRTHTSGRPCWCKMPDRQASQRIITVYDEACILLTISPGQIRIESYIGCGCWRCNSNHWLMKGPAKHPDRALQEDTVIMQLGGKDCFVAAPPIVFYTEKTSYGMSNLVPTQMVGPQQIMIMDANLPEIRVGAPGWLDHVKARHMGKVNYVTPGGTVRSITKAELQREYDHLEEEGIAGGSLLGTRASPRDGH